jgi:hypothetical protein
MTTVIIIDKNGKLKELKTKTYCLEDLYKKAGFKTSVDFIKHHVFNISLNDIDYSISLYGKLTGKANQENKYEFPPPVDKLLFFGNCLLVNNDISRNPIPLSLNDWKNAYDYLFNGFDYCDDDDCEDCDGEDCDVDSEENMIDSSLMTKEGYMRDNFIVDDDDDDDEGDDNSGNDSNNDSDNESNNYSENKKKVIMKRKLPLKKKAAVTKKIEIVEEERYLDCSCELTSEEYFA